MSASPASQPEPSRTGPRLNPDSWRNANQTADWLKSSVRTCFLSDKADSDIYSYDPPPREDSGIGQLKGTKPSRHVYFHTMRGYGPPDNNIGLPGDIYWDLTSFDRYVLWTHNLEKWVVWNWSDTKPTKTQFELVWHPFVKGRYLWGTPSQKLGWRSPIWLTRNCSEPISHFDYQDHQDPQMLLKGIFNEERSAPEGPVSALNQVRMNVEENRRKLLLENASKKGRLFHPPPDDQLPPRADQARPFKPRKRSENHRRSSSERDPSWTPTGSAAKRRRMSGADVQTATPRRKTLPTPSSASVSQSPTISTAQAPQQIVNGDQSSGQSLRASSLLATQTSSTPAGPSHQTAPERESGVADPDLDDFFDAAYAKAVKVFQEMMQSEKKQLKIAVLAHSAENKRRRIEAEEDAKKARAEATAAKEKLGQIHGLLADKI